MDEYYQKKYLTIALTMNHTDFLNLTYRKMLVRVCDIQKYFLYLTCQTVVLSYCLYKYQWKELSNHQDKFQGT